MLGAVGLIVEVYGLIPHFLMIKMNTNERGMTRDTFAEIKTKIAEADRRKR